MRYFRPAIRLLAALAVMAMPVATMAQTLIIRIAPPELPVYEQPAMPEYGYIWAPGYWAYGPDGYFWVPGTWVQPPSVGLLWTPGYWGWHDGVYGWNEGYWGPHIGFYGGVDYGFGYGGVGYEGGRWENGVFAYNRTVNNFGSVTVTHFYSQTVVHNTSVTRASFNGGSGGTTAQPTPQEQSAAHERHVAPTALQSQHEHTASTDKTLLASVNHGKPAIAATAKPGEFAGKGVVPAKAVLPSTVSPSTVSPRTASPSTVSPRTAPAGAAVLDKPAAAGALEKKRSSGNARPAASGATPLKPASTPTRPVAVVSPPKAPAVKPAAPPPHPVAAVRPAPAKPPAPPPKKKPPG